MMNILLKTKAINHLLTRKSNGSITVEAAFSFTITIFVLFLMIGPLLIVKTSSDILYELNEISKYRCNYEIIKENSSFLREKLNTYIDDEDTVDKNVGLFEIMSSYLVLASRINEKYDETKSEYRNIDTVFDENHEVYDDATGIVRYDYDISFNLPYNILFISNIRKRLLVSRRAFVGAVGDRFSRGLDGGDYVYVANNYVNSSVYHTYIDCTYLIKRVESVEYENVGTKRNENNQKYTKCPYCFRNVKIKYDTSCYITEYGDRFHYKSNCPLMTAYVTKIPIEYIEQYGLRKCSRCSERGD